MVISWVIFYKLIDFLESQGKTRVGDVSLSYLTSSGLPVEAANIQLPLMSKNMMNFITFFYPFVRLLFLLCSTHLIPYFMLLRNLGNYT